MFNCRKFRPCWKKPYIRAMVTLFILSLPGLVTYTLYLKEMSVSRLEKVSTNPAMNIDYRVNSTHLVAASWPQSVNRQNLHIAGSGTSQTHVTAPTAMTKVITKQEARLKNESPMHAHGTQITTSTPNQKVTKTSANSKKFLFYVCDRKMYCYGLGDRQRGLFSVYMLAELTNRTFGIILTAPSNFTEFYKPNLVPWDIPPSELEGKSSVEIVAYGPKSKFGLYEIDFNAEYPQDIVYIRTNNKFIYALQSNPLYKNNFPAWAKIPQWKLFQVAWLRLMTPTQTLRLMVNTMLAEIAQKMQDEFTVSEILNNSNCCEGKFVNIPLCVNSSCDGKQPQNLCCNLNSSIKMIDRIKTCSNETCNDKTNTTDCTGVVCNKTSSSNCSETKCTGSLETTSILDTKNNITFKCVLILKDKLTNMSNLFWMEHIARNFCQESRPVLEPLTSVESIHQKQEYDLVDLNLVCVHIRLGHSKTFPFEKNVRNKLETVTAVWEFLELYIANGRHVYLATDSQEVRDQAKSIFGNRVHVSSIPITHIAISQKGQDERSSFRNFSRPSIDNKKPFYISTADINKPGAKK